MRRALAAIAALVCAFGIGAVVSSTTAHADTTYVVATQQVTAQFSGTINALNNRVYVVCPEGTYATGGGGIIDESDPNQYYVKESQALLGTGAVPVGWDVTFGFTGSLPVATSPSLFAQAVCTVGE